MSGGTQAELQAQIEAFASAAGKSAASFWENVVVPLAAAYERAAAEYLERNRPVFEAMTALARAPHSDRPDAPQVTQGDGSGALWLVTAKSADFHGK